MIKDFRISISRDNGGIAFTILSENSPLPGTRLTMRQVPNLPLNMVDEIRQGTPQLPTVMQVTNLVSDWLLLPDLKPYLDAAMNSLKKNEKLRVIFYVDGELRRDAQLGDPLGDLPFELLVIRPDIVPLVVNPKVSAFVHLLEKVPHAGSSATQRQPPLRVLLVHSNPKSLGGAVPDPLPIRGEILSLGEQSGISLIEVDVLTRQVGSGVSGLPTPEGLWKQLHESPIPYDILIYLGHGDRPQYRDDLLPLGLLYLESPDGNENVPVTADVLAGELHNHPVPVVLLVGCLTAADIVPELRDGVLKSMINSMRGNQGVAQALVNSSSGVQLAVGMRARLETVDARLFILTFFESLLLRVPGDVEAAVHAGREKMRAIDASKASWAAPVVFRVLQDEPTFDFLATRPTVTIDERDLAIRSLFWEHLRQQSWIKGSPEPINAMSQTLQQFEFQLVQNLRQKTALMMPEWRLVQRDQRVQLPIQLYGQLNVDQLEGELTVDGEDVTIEKVDGTEPVRNSYKVLSGIEGHKAYFQFTRKPSGVALIPDGPLMVVDLQLGSTTNVTYPVSVTALTSQPDRTICAGNNVVIVAGP